MKIVAQAGPEIESLPLTISVSMSVSEWRLVGDALDGFVGPVPVHLFRNGVRAAIAKVTDAVEAVVLGQDVRK
jgi:hypothetical protein